MAICGSILSATGSYQVVFVVTGLLVLATIWVIWVLIERDKGAEG